MARLEKLTPMQSKDFTHCGYIEREIWYDKSNKICVLIVKLKGIDYFCESVSQK